MCIASSFIHYILLQWTNTNISLNSSSHSLREMCRLYAWASFFYTFTCTQNSLYFFSFFFFFHHFECNFLSEKIWFSLMKLNKFSCNVLLCTCCLRSISHILKMLMSLKKIQIVVARSKNATTRLLCHTIIKWKINIKNNKVSDYMNK